jgi:hypothetical protein
MKTMLTIEQLVQEVERQAQPGVKQDFLPRTTDMRYVMRPADVVEALEHEIAVAAGNGRKRRNGSVLLDAPDPDAGTERDLGTSLVPVLVWPEREHDAGLRSMPLNDHAHSQLAQHLGIPTTFYWKLAKDHPELLAQNVNALLADQPADEVRMVRTLDGKVRAFVSNTYEPLDNRDFLRAMLPLLNPQAGGTPVEWESAGLTDTQMFVKFTIKNFERTLRVGTVLAMGGLYGNSEVGVGKRKFAPFYKVLSCLNGAWFYRYGNVTTARRHVGARKPAYSDPRTWSITEVVERRRREQADFYDLSAAVRKALQPASLDKLTMPMVNAMRVEVRHPAAAVEVVAQRMGLTQEDQAGVLPYFMDSRYLGSKDWSIWSLSNAITRYSQDVDSYDRATELEKVGGDIIALPQSEWRVIANAEPKPRKGAEVA